MNILIVILAMKFMFRFRTPCGWRQTSIVDAPGPSKLSEYLYATTVCGEDVD